MFGPVYAETYDRLYEAKNYQQECDLLETVFRRYGASPVRTILDLGCGTGNHSFALAGRGYKVTGVDRSQEMIQKAGGKAVAGNGSVRFHAADIRNLNLNCNFDAVLMMFAVLGYQTLNRDVLAALQTANRHLKPGGLLLFDCWYGPAVLSERPGDRFKVVPLAGGGRLLRSASSRLDERRHCCRVEYELWCLSDSNVLSHDTEQHVMRYFFPLEIELFLDLCGFELRRLGSFAEIDRDPDCSTWNVVVVGSKTRDVPLRM